MLTEAVESWYLHALFSPVVLGHASAQSECPLVVPLGPTIMQQVIALVSNSIQSLRPMGRVFSLLCLLAILAGCRRGMVYDAAGLPDEFRVAPASKVSEHNLTRLAVPGGNNAIIGADDILQLTIATGFEETPVNPTAVRVNGDGLVHVPLVGPVTVAGLEPAEAERAIASFAIERGVYRNPSVTLLVEKQKTNKVTVVGSVESPGVYELPRSSSDLLGALAMAGGRAEDAGSDIEILRNKQTSQSGAGGIPAQGPSGDKLASYSSEVPVRPASVRINMDLVAQGQVGDYRLNDGDVVMVYQQEPRVVHVIGLVHKPGEFEIDPGEDVYLLDALALAGGRTMQIADKFQIVRRVEGQSSPLVVEGSVRSAKADGSANIRLAPGDLVSVEETPTTMALDLLKSFIRFGVSASAPVF
jgi:polysaccharide export outer membrane protein